MAGGLYAEHDQLLVARHLVLVQQHPRLEIGGHSQPQGVISGPAVTVVGSVRSLAPGRRSVPNILHRPWKTKKVEIQKNISEIV